MSKYLKTIGVIEIVATIILFIANIIVCIRDKTPFFGWLVSSAAIAFFSPAFGIALYTLGDLLENNDSRLNSVKRDIGHEHVKILELKKELDSVRKEIGSLKESDHFVRTLMKKIDEL